MFPNRLPGRMLGLNAMLAAAGTAIGPVLGGTLLATLGWEWIFAINVPLDIIAVMPSLSAIPDARIHYPDMAPELRQ